MPVNDLAEPPRRPHHLHHPYNLVTSRPDRQPFPQFSFLFSSSRLFVFISITGWFNFCVDCNGAFSLKKKKKKEKKKRSSSSAGMRGVEILQTVAGDLFIFVLMTRLRPVLATWYISTPK